MQKVKLKIYNDVFNIIYSYVLVFKRYGSFSNEAVYYFENEIHNSFYSCDISSKSRFKLDKEEIKGFCQGKHTVTYNAGLAEGVEMNEKEAMKHNINDFSSFARTTQDVIHSRELKPILQCNYNRLTFELPNNDDRLIITLDTDIEFYQQYNTQDFTSSNKSNEKQKKIFPYAILEVRLSTNLKMDDPSLYWINAFTQKSKLVHEVPKFSKYMQGVYQVFLNQDNTITNQKQPSWIGFYQKGISTSIQHDGLSRSRSLRPLLNGKDFRSIIPYTNTRSRTSSVVFSSQKYHDSSLRSSHSNSEHASVSSKNSNLARSAVIVQNKNPKAVLDMNEKTEMHSPSMDNKANSYSSYFRHSDWNSNSNSNDNSTRKLILDQDGHPIVYKNQPQAFYYNKASKSKDFDIEKGVAQKNNKKKEKAIKIEPKVFFANERTFIAWLQFSALLLTIALNLLNFGDKISRICGSVFLLIAMLLALYALARFQYRAWQLRTPSQNGRFDDVYGPAALCILIVSALVINFWLRFKYLSNADDKSTYLRNASG